MVISTHPEKQKMSKTEFLVAHAEFSTGIILTVDLATHTRVGEIFKRFSTREAAVNYMLQLVSNRPDIECLLRTSEGRYLLQVDREGIKKR